MEGMTLHDFLTMVAQFIIFVLLPWVVILAAAYGVYSFVENHML